MRLAILCSPESWYLNDLRRAAADRHELPRVEFHELASAWDGTRLQVTAGRLATVTATVTATDDYDTQPEIKLESITANEPLAAGDITGAALGTNDRQFQLRDVKVPSGTTGRIYTITYSATDGTGNKAMASATVSVK